MKKLFLTTTSLVSHVLEIIKDIKEYTIIEVDHNKSLPEILVDAKIFSTVSDAENAGYIGKIIPGYYSYTIKDMHITMLI